MKPDRAIRFLAKAGITLLLAAFAFAGTAHAEEDPFESLARGASSLFTPVEGRVTEIVNGAVMSDLGTGSGIRAGMRLTVTREGAPFVHPVTREVLGMIESHVGRAEVVEAGPGSSSLRVISGSPEAGDILRVSSAQVRLLFYQYSDVDWNVSEKYYETLRKTGRFDLIDTAPGSASEKEIAEEARRMGAEAALVLTQSKAEDGISLKQKLLWAEDGTELHAESAVVKADLLAKLSIGSELFMPKKDYIIVFEVPMSTSVIERGDIDGDGNVELLLGTPAEISFHRVNGPLDAALGGLELKGPKSEQFIWVDVHDLDGDGKDEIVVTSMASDGVVGRIYKYKDGKLSEELKGNYFLRVIDGALYGQEHVRGEGYKGPVFMVKWGGGKGTDRSGALDIPEGVNIYDFNFIQTSEGKRAVIAYDDAGYLNLYDHEGKLTWRSRGRYSEPLLSFKKKARGTANIRQTDSDTAVYSKDAWSVKDKLLVSGNSALAVNRIPLSEKAPGVGVKGSQVVGLRQIGPSFQETAVVKDISGSVKGMAVVGERLYVLVSPPLGLDTKKLLKGKNPLVSRIYIYSLKGI